MSRNLHVILVPNFDKMMGENTCILGVMGFFTAKHPKRTRQEIVASELRGVGFDWDETLFDIQRDSEFYYNSAQYAVSHSLADQHITPDETQKQAIEKALKAYGENENHNQAAQKGLVASISQILKIPAESQEKMQYAFAQHYPDYRATPEFLRSGKAKLIDGAKQLLIFLKSEGVPFFIASNSEQGCVRAAVKEFLGDVLSDEEIKTRVLGTSKVAVESNSGGYLDGFPRKPDPTMLKYGFSSIQANPDPQSRRGIYYVGNSVNSDVVTALRAGVSPILFTGIEKASGEQEEGLVVTNNITKPGTAEEVAARMYDKNGNPRRDAEGEIMHYRADVVTIDIEQHGSKKKHFVPVAHDHAELQRMFENRLKSAVEKSNLF